MRAAQSPYARADLVASVPAAHEHLPLDEIGGEPMDGGQGQPASTGQLGEVQAPVFAVERAQGRGGS